MCVSSVRRAGRQPGEELSFIGAARGDDTDRSSLLAGSVSIRNRRSINLIRSACSNRFAKVYSRDLVYIPLNRARKLVFLDFRFVSPSRFRAVSTELVGMMHDRYLSN